MPREVLYSESNGHLNGSWAVTLVSHLYSKSVKAGFWLAVSTFLSHFGQVNGATINVKSVSFGDVRSAVGSAKDGDTVSVPAGTANWTFTCIITKHCALRRGDDKTIILDDIPGNSVANRGDSAGRNATNAADNVSSNRRTAAGGRQQLRQQHRRTPRLNGQIRRLQRRLHRQHCPLKPMPTSTEDGGTLQHLFDRT